MDRGSYTAANEFPVKLLKSTDAVDKEGRVYPIHAQVIVTNKCNLKCKFCSYADRENHTEMSWADLEFILRVLSANKCKAITWTGGGEPLMSDKINDALEIASDMGISSGLVTNGVLLKRLKRHKGLKWCRVSTSDDRDLTANEIVAAIKVNPDTGWALSYVLTKDYDLDKLNKAIEFANKYRLTHIRVVSDLLDSVNVMDEVKKNIKVDTSRVIWQNRKQFCVGVNPCCVSLLRIMISPEGIFPCCGVVYAINGQERKHIDEMRMGTIRELDTVLKQQRFFDGSVCDRCYYGAYNRVLLGKITPVEFEEFL